MQIAPQARFIAFTGTERLAEGSAAEVATAVKALALAQGTDHPDALVFDAETSDPIDLNLRGTLQDVLERLSPTLEPETEAVARGPGRPKLGVVAREVTLLPRHWEWLAEQPGGASVTLRKLVERARRDTAGADLARRSREAAYRFMTAMAGNMPGFEEASRALYGGDAESFSACTDSWPVDVRDHTRSLAAPAFSPVSAGHE